MQSVDEAELEQILAAPCGTVVVLFGATWSAPSRSVASILTRLEANHAGEAQFVIMNVVEHPSGGDQYDIVGTPTVCVFKQGKVVARYAGMRSIQEYESSL